MKITKLIIIVIAFVSLAGCNTHKVKVDLTDERRADIKSEIKELKAEIANFEPSENAAIAWQAIIDLARTYEELGEFGKAIKLYKDTLAAGTATKGIINNLGRLYEKTEQYELAVQQYQRLIEDYFDLNYFYDITWAYIRAKERKNAEKYFNAWQLEFKKTDEQTQQAIKNLRKAEKDASS